MVRSSAIAGFGDSFFELPKKAKKPLDLTTVESRSLLFTRT